MLTERTVLRVLQNETFAVLRTVIVSDRGVIIELQKLRIIFYEMIGEVEECQNIFLFSSF